MYTEVISSYYSQDVTFTCIVAHVPSGTNKSVAIWEALQKWQRYLVLAYMSAYMQVLTCVHARADMCACTCWHVCMHVLTCVHARSRADMCTCTMKEVSTNKGVCIEVIVIMSTLSHTHTHTHPQWTTVMSPSKGNDMKVTQNNNILRFLMWTREADEGALQAYASLTRET